MQETIKAIETLPAVLQYGGWALFCIFIIGSFLVVWKLGKVFIETKRDIELEKIKNGNDDVFEVIKSLVSELSKSIARLDNQFNSLSEEIKELRNELKELKQNNNLKTFMKPD